MASAPPYARYRFMSSGSSIGYGELIVALSHLRKKTPNIYSQHTSTGLDHHVKIHAILTAALDTTKN